MLEQVFAIPGLGKYMVDAIKTNNYPVVQGSVLYMSIVFSLVNLLIDILYAFIDPRVKALFRTRDAKGRQKRQARFSEGG